MNDTQNVPIASTNDRDESDTSGRIEPSETSIPTAVAATVQQQQGKEHTTTAASISLNTAAAAATTTTPEPTGQKRKRASEVVGHVVVNADWSQKRRMQYQAAYNGDRKLAEDRQHREDIVRGYELLSGVAVLENQAMTNHSIGEHAVAKEYLLGTIETMREEAKELWEAQQHYFSDWERQFLQLCQYKLEHGNLDITKENNNKELYAFMRRQRGLKSRLKRQEMKRESTFEVGQHRVQVLEKIGFPWNSIPSISITRPFEEHVKDLLAFKEKHGHCLVPTRKSLPKDFTPELRNLSNWVSRQRRLYHEMKAHDPSKPRPRTMMTEEQAQRLEEIGFVWNGSTSDKTWDDYFEMLLQFKAIHGHCKVPQMYQANQELGHWVHRMRKYHRDILRGGKTTALTDERIQRLEAVGFLWKTKKTPNRDYTKKKAPPPPVQPAPEVGTITDSSNAASEFAQLIW